MYCQKTIPRVLKAIMAVTAQSQSDPPEVRCLSAFGGFWSSELDKPMVVKRKKVVEKS